ncbi:MAG: neutral zinc metallopeptidase [Paracoccaceae bacterium]
MRLKGVRGSRNVEDRRGQRGRAGAGAGIGGVGLLIILAIGYFAGVDVTPLLNGQLDSGGQQTAGAPRELTPEERKAGDFAVKVLATTEDVWGKVFPQDFGKPYRAPVLVLYSGVTQSPCGGASGATGPFYCPGDRKIYLDTEFFATMSRQLGAKGDFAEAYVIGHEVAHHVQNELGIIPKVDAARKRASEVKANALTVRLELQADCLAGVWGRHVDGLLEPGDVEEALNAARQIGDDTLQRRAGRVPQPHTFTHGTSAQRQRWFAEGYDSGDPNSCDTFGTDSL